MVGDLLGRTDAAGERAGAFTRDIDEFCISSELVEEGEKAIGLRELLIVVIGFDLQDHVIHTKAIVAHGALEIGKIGFLTGQPFENAQELCCRGIERVVETGLVRFTALFIAKGFLAKIGEPPVDFQINALKSWSFAARSKIFCASMTLMSKGCVLGSSSSCRIS